MKKAKWFSEEAFQITEKRRDAKSKGEKKRYTHLNAELQRQQGEIRKPSSAISAKKEKKTIEWERLEISSRKLEIPFRAKMSTEKSRNCMDLTEAEEVKKRCQEYTELYIQKKIFMTQIIIMV